MFTANPIFLAKEVGLSRQPLGCPVPEDLRRTVTLILKALQLVTPLRALQDHQVGVFLDDMAARQLSSSIFQHLTAAAQSSGSPQLRAVLESRAAAYVGAPFADGARLNAASTGLPVELMISSIPSWRFSSRPHLGNYIVAIMQCEPAGMEVSPTLAIHGFAAYHLL